MRLDREITCAEVVELVTSYLDNALSARDRERFEEHLVFCDGCDNYLEQMHRTVQLTGRLRETDIPPALRERLLETFRSWHAA